jgi:hypothetical protein
MEGIYGVSVEMGSGGMLRAPSFMRRSSNIKFCLSNLNGCNADITDGREV